MDRGGYSVSLIRQSLSLPYESHPHDIISTMYNNIMLGGDPILVLGSQ